MFDKVIIIGIFVSLIYSELTGFSSSGLVVPGYLAINLNNPERILYTFCLSLLTYICIKVLSNFAIIYGKRQFSLAIGLSILLNILLTGILPFNFGVIGNIIAGLICNNWLKEGIFQSSLSLLIVSSIVVLFMVILKIPIFR
ncbi:MAG: poly-gamma-glutamate biosynthesis protein PgsC [Bacillota bacterium]|nr:poly-gamma-glutamate biosynthesis protein PgsC [Bacillota bacterium]